jgi:hypothetical protein
LNLTNISLINERAIDNCHALREIVCESMEQFYKLYLAGLNEYAFASFINTYAKDKTREVYELISSTTTQDSE